MVHNRLILLHLSFTLSTRRSIPWFRWPRNLVVESSIKLVIVLRGDVMTYRTTCHSSAEHSITCLIDTHKLSRGGLDITVSLDFILWSYKLTLLVGPISRRHVMIVVVMELLILHGQEIWIIHSTFFWRTLIDPFCGALWSNHVVYLVSWSNILEWIMVVFMMLVIIVIKHITNTDIVERHRVLLIVVLIILLEVMMLNNIIIFNFERPFYLTIIIIQIAVFYSQAFHLRVILHGWKRLKVYLEALGDVWCHLSTRCWLLFVVIPTRTGNSPFEVIQEISSWLFWGEIGLIFLFGTSTSFTSRPSSWSF